METSYKEKYEQALAKAKEQYNYPCMRSCMGILEEIFPELAESEDEKVRKKIINYFQCQSEEEPTRKEVHNKWIAWLEKQGEQIDIANKEYWRGYREGKKEILDKYAEQSKQKSVEWSEDDETALTNTIIMLKEGASHHFLNSSIVPCVNWLKSLKDRVQPKQEWSEEDEEILRTILSDGIRGAELDMLQVNWLKSLRPQNHWKPSEGDIIILEKLINGELEPKVFQATLHGILEQLKKLRDE